MTLQIPDLDDLLASEGQSAEQAAREIIILDLFRQRRVSGGKASQLLSISRMEFIELVARHDICYFNQTPEELDREIESLKDFSPAHRL
jgi:predicted HTH domain antitoxin